MPTLILADVHGNLPALEAVLAHPAARSCTDVISLGDHVNFGPQSRQVHERLVSLNAMMLLGNHEERLTRPADAEFDGYNWRLMRWTAAQMADIDLHLPTDIRRGNVLYTHGTPGDPYHLVYKQDLPALLETLPEGTLLISGHNHHRWDVTHAGRRAFNPGSVGLAEDGRGAVAPFAVLDGEEIIRYEAPYNVNATLRAFVETGLHRAAPEWARMVVLVMQTAEYQGGLKLVQHVRSVAEQMGLTLGDEAAWKAADLTYPWPEAISSEEYWDRMEKSL